MVSPPLRHVRPVQPRVFPSSDLEWELPESKRQSLSRLMLFELLRRLVGPASSTGTDQFVYWDADDPKKCLAPDAFVKLGVPDSVFDSWKTWEHGAPELCVEILSPSDTTEFLTAAQKMTRYRSMGVRELVVFDFDAEIGRRLRVFDRVRGDLVERVVANEVTPCLVLAEALGDRVDWVLAAGDLLPATLRLSCDGALVPMPGEAEHAAREAERAANARAAELEREIARLRRR